ncbi:hypothetical protein NQ315_012503 [Exocentrus adspersus]|uniref:Uncharacterized protein n=1 Tax=Exocentrus adspersus TaxID=1586481 RepID=A0AAV8V8U6_9CUCU|nr:hypothetical protein NQ315_012503 [Exocentrus adspersus]
MAAGADVQSNSSVNVGNKCNKSIVKNIWSDNVINCCIVSDCNVDIDEDEFLNALDEVQKKVPDSKPAALTQIVGNKKPIPENKQITQKQVTAGILLAQTEVALNKHINLNNDLQDISSPLETTNERLHVTDSTIQARRSHIDSHQNEWSTVVKRKRRRQQIVGSKEDTSLIRGVPKYVSLHVYRINLETSAADLTEMLKLNFLEVTCQSLSSKYPGLYNSFKVMVRIK